jgi:hypothetical protein
MWEINYDWIVGNPELSESDAVRAQGCSFAAGIR